MAKDTVVEEQQGHVLTLTMNRPKQRNAFNAAMWGGMRDGLRDARSQDSVRCVVVTGAEGAFSAGQDLGEMTSVSDGGEGSGGHPFGEFMDELLRS